ncbi:MAG: fructose-1,6-bisphosphatase [Tissierellia bacterium]|nr:fructose-1,6-bisphosphatase [Tissierellia bacterium]
MDEKKYLELLSVQYPTIAKASSEIVELTAKTVLPKGTEYFLSDLHGQYDSFDRILRSASGNTREKISLEFGDEISEDEKNQLANLIYEPRNFIKILKKSDHYTRTWKLTSIHRLIRLTKRVASKYSRSKVREQIDYSYRDLIDELLHVSHKDLNKEKYFNTLIETIVEIDQAESFIITLCEAIQSLNIDRLHIVGDIYDRGSRPDIIMDALIEHEDVDIQWGNHDITWIGAFLGSDVLVANTVRNALSYNNFDSLEHAYGINLRPLSLFAEHVYSDDPCERFQVRHLPSNQYENISTDLASKMHKAISIIQFKLESQLIERNPEYLLEHRQVLYRTDFDRGIYTDAEGNEHEMRDKNFPTINRKNPNVLTPEERDVLDSLKASFLYSDRLKEHMDYMIEKGGSYKIVNGNLLFHGCIPMNEDGSFQTVHFNGSDYRGKSLMDFFDQAVRDAQYLKPGDLRRQEKLDLLWYMWCGPKSTMFGKSQISTYENFFIHCKKARKEHLNPYFDLIQEEKYVDIIFEEFDLNPERGHIINGHMPVKSKDGENPIKANGKVYVIDGGISEAYQQKTGIAGYTLTFNSHHLALAEHRDYETMESVHGAYSPTVYVTEKFPKRQLIRDTDRGKILLEKIDDLKRLVKEYRKGTIKEKSHIIGDHINYKF